MGASDVHRLEHGRHGQHGAIAIMFAVLLVPIVGICALAIDLAVVYNRKAEMHGVARAVAISAAKRLNGTSAGIDNAVADAAATARVAKFRNLSQTIAWSPAALRFSATPNRDGSWVEAASAAGNPAKMLYVKVDTSAFGSDGVVQMALARVLSASLDSVATSSEVIAGRTDIAVAPLAVCAMSTTPAASRNNSASYVELVEYGFRRGVSYDLMNLNPNGTAPLNYVINPLAMPGAAGNPAHLAIATLGPYVCNGTLGVPGVLGGALAVARPFPLGQLYRQLNSRFDQYDGGVCTPSGAPPDYNIKAYDYTAMVTPLKWLTTAPLGQTAATSSSGTRLGTVAELPPPGGTAAQYGPLWAYARAVPYTSYTASPVEPVAGYATMSTSAWPTLYGNQIAKSGYPASTPYKANPGDNLVRPAAAHGSGLRNRRVLNVALLDCAASSATSASMLAVGRFFMTVPATDKVLAAEFAGTLPFDRIPGNVGLFQ